MASLSTLDASQAFWATFFNAEPTEHEWLAAKSLAGSWSTCPSAEAEIPRDKAGVPRDYILWCLGNGFSNLIRERNLPAAKVMLIRIKERLAYLITNPKVPL